MYEYFRGRLVETSSQTIVLDVNGIGYRLPIPLSHFSKLPELGSELCVYTSFIVREASQSIYAFLGRSERDLFELLINISGVGPKTALALIGHLSIEELDLAIQSGNISLLSKVPGIGKKTAERLIVELKDKLPEFASYSTTPLEPVKNNQIVKDALNALMNLGYQHTVAAQAIKKALAALPEDTDLPGIISHILRTKSITK